MARPSKLSLVLCMGRGARGSVLDRDTRLRARSGDAGLSGRVGDDGDVNGEVVFAPSPGERRKGGGSVAERDGGGRERSLRPMSSSTGSSGIATTVVEASGGGMEG